MTGLADAIVAASWREVLRSQLARALRERARKLRHMVETNGPRIGVDGQMAIAHHIARLEREIYGTPVNGG